MKKKLMLSILLILVVSLTVACGGNSGGESAKNSDTSKAGSEKSKEQPPEKKVNTVNIGDTIKDDRAEITIKNIEFSYDVLPEDVSGFYSHYPADSGQVYVHIDTDVKNVQKQELPCDEIMKVSVDYNNGYKYKGFAIVEDPNLGFTHSNIESIDPLGTKGIRFLVDCPQEVAESQNPVKVIFTLGKTKYEYQMR